MLRLTSKYFLRVKTLLLELYVHVFAFTLDCNKRTYCYDTEDACGSSRLAEKQQQLKCHSEAPLQLTSTIILLHANQDNRDGDSVDCTCTGSLLK